MDKMKTIATFDRDTKHFRRFLIDDGQGVSGTLYLPKSEQVPEVLEIELRSKAPEAGK